VGSSVVGAGDGSEALLTCGGLKTNKKGVWLKANNVI
jgi:hypothetical protein